MYENLPLISLIISIIALVLLLLKLRADGGKKYQLKKDASGFWKYHEDTEFERKAAYETQLDESEDSKSKRVRIL